MTTRHFFPGYSKAYIMLVAVMGLLLSAGLPSAYGSTVIAFDATANNSCPAACGSTLSWSHTVGAGSNPILVVGISLVKFGLGSAVVSGVTFGANSLTSSPSLTKMDPSGLYTAEIWYLLNPPTGLGTVTVTFSTIPSAAVGSSVSYFNVAGVGSSNTGSGSSTSASVTVNANAGDLVVDTISTYDGTFPGGVTPVPAAQTQRWNVFASYVVGAGSDQPASSPVTMTWALLHVDDWAIVGIDLQPFIPPTTTATTQTTFAPVHQTPVGGVMLPSVGLSVLLPWAIVLSLLGVLSVEAFRVKRRAKQR
jgi:hypothetical protein